MPHTPGPWKVGSRDNDNPYKVEKINIAGKDGWHVCQVSSREENDDNARLIAAAPEMLEALKRVYDHIEGRKLWLLMSHEISSIIDRAEGGE